MITNLAFFALLSSGSVFCSAWFKRKYEEVLPITAMALVLLVFLFGCVGYLKLGFFVSVAVSFLLYCLSVYKLFQRKNLRSFMKSFASSGFFMFLFAFILLSFFNHGKIACMWDEFSHWVDIVKTMTALDDFGTNPLSFSRFKTYPPAMSIFQYVLQKIGFLLHRDFVFNEWRAFFSYQIFFVAIISPIFHLFSIKKPLSFITATAIVFLVPLPFFHDFYNSVLIDPFLGILTGIGIFLIVAQKKHDIFYHTTLLLLCSILVLSKDVGFLLAIFLAAVYVFDCLQESSAFSRHNKFYPFAAIGAVMVPKILWSREIAVHQLTSSFSGNYNISAFIKVLLRKDKTYYTTVWDNYLDALFDKTFPIGNSPTSINYFTLFIITLLALYGVYRLHSKHYPFKIRKIKMICICTAVILSIYILGMALTFMFKFTEYEAVKLASFERYLNIVFLFVWLFIALTTLFILTECLSSKGVIAVFLCALLIVTPLKNVITFVNGTTVKESITIRKPYEPLSKLIHTVCDGNDKIFFISQDTSGFDYWVTRYNARPNQITGWAIGESDYYNGMYQYLYSAEEWQALLVKEFDYVALFKLNDYFFKHYTVLFEEPLNIETNALYKVDKPSGLLKKCVP